MTDWTAEIVKAADRVAGHIRRTPVIAATRHDLPYEMKLEHLQHTGTFDAQLSIRARERFPCTDSYR